MKLEDILLENILGGWSIYTRTETTSVNVGGQHTTRVDFLGTFWKLVSALIGGDIVVLIVLCIAKSHYKSFPRQS